VGDLTFSAVKSHKMQVTCHTRNAGDLENSDHGLLCMFVMRDAVSISDSRSCDRNPWFHLGHLGQTLCVESQGLGVKSCGLRIDLEDEGLEVIDK